MGLLDKLTSNPQNDSSNPAQPSSVVSKNQVDEFEDAEEAQLHEHAHKLGGLACHDSKLREEQQEAIMVWITAMGKNLLMGNGLASTPAPVQIFEPRSNLQKITDTWRYTHFLVDAAAEADKVRRLALVVAWFIAGLRHTSDTWRKPFNPILGETWQGESRLGCEVFLEQISHHPPIASFRMRDKQGRFEFAGTCEGTIQVSVKHRGFTQQFKGPRILTFADGDQVEFTEMPTFMTKGVTSNADLRADVAGHATITYRQADLVAKLAFGPSDLASPLYSRTDSVTGYICAGAGAAQSASGAPTPRGGSESDDAELSEALSDMDLQPDGSESGGVPNPTGGDCTRKAERRSDSGHSGPLSGHSRSWVPSWVREQTGKQSHSTSASPRAAPGLTGMFGRIAKNAFPRGAQAGSELEGARGTFKGNWLSHLDYESETGVVERLWTLTDEETVPFVDVPEAERRPTDCSFRKDMHRLAEGDVKGAQAAKDEIEETQRQLRKARKEREKELAKQKAAA